MLSHQPQRPAHGAPRQTMTTTTPKTRTITLTDRAPVRILDDDWGVIASAKDWDGQHEAQANRTWAIRVREHVTDGRVIVHGAYTSAWQNERDSKAGELLEGREPTSASSGNNADVVAAIRRVCESIGGAESLAAACIADLPAQTI